MRRRTLLPLTLAAMALSAQLMGAEGCEAFVEQLGQTQAGELLPEVEAGGLALRHGPGLEELGAFYCPQVIDDALVALGCAVALGPPPAKSSLVFEFGVVVNIHNPNDIPVPALDVLLALVLFDGADAESLGAICVSLCGTDDPSCDGTPRPGACEPQGDDIRSLDDFIGRIPGLVAALATGQALDELRKSTIAAGGDVSLDLSFALGIDQALSVFEKTALTYVEDQLAGRSTSLTVPVSTEGTVYFQLPLLGRIGVDFGPLSSSWRVL